MSTPNQVGGYNDHLVTALQDVESGLIALEGQSVTFPIQEGPIAEAGENGCDATDLIRFTIGLYRSFNSAVPCRENSITITKLEEALMWQEKRTQVRVKRGVEGTNKPVPVSAGVEAGDTPLA